MKTETSFSKCDCNWLPPQRMKLTCRSKSSVSRLITHCFLFILHAGYDKFTTLFTPHDKILIGRQIMNLINYRIRNRNLKFIHYLKWTSSEYMTVLHTDGISNMIYGFWKKVKKLRKEMTIFWLFVEFNQETLQLLTFSIAISWSSAAFALVSSIIFSACPIRPK